MCSTTVDATLGRIKTRAAGNSDATPEIAAALAARDNGWDTAYPIDTSQPLQYSARKAADVWRRAI
jgi:predicted kinase